MGDDRDLWQQALQGDSHAFGTLFEHHANSVFMYCLRRTGSWETAEDLTSVVFLEAWRRRADVFPHGPSALPWLYGIALGVTRNHHRAVSRYRAALAKIPVADADHDHVDAVAERVDAEAKVAAVNSELRRLPRREREVVEVCVWLGLTRSEAAEVLGVPVGTVKSRLARAQRKLRHALLDSRKERSATV